VINRIKVLESSLDGGLENARNKLALLVSDWSHRHRAFQCVIVFDGRDKFAGGYERLAGIRCIFSQSAHGGDDEIIRFVRDFSGRPSDITVVSDDNNVRNNCRAHGASVETSSYLITKKAPRPGVSPKRSSDRRGLDDKAAAEIDRELRKKFGL
jgi:predicted RNA-binding protein with PIN domain